MESMSKYTESTVQRDSLKRFSSILTGLVRRPKSILRKSNRKKYAISVCNNDKNEKDGKVNWKEREGNKRAEKRERRKEEEDAELAQSKRITYCSNALISDSASNLTYFFLTNSLIAFSINFGENRVSFFI